MPELIAPDHSTLTYLETLEARLAAIQILSGGTCAWASIRRLREEVRQEIAAGWEGLERMAEEMMKSQWAIEQCPENPMSREWVVIDAEGEEIKAFGTREDAEEWLSTNQLHFR
jgi:hypothetical protein